MAGGRCDGRVTYPAQVGGEGGAARPTALSGWIVDGEPVVDVWWTGGCACITSAIFYSRARASPTPISRLNLFSTTRHQFYNAINKPYSRHHHSAVTICRPSTYKRAASSSNAPFILRSRRTNTL